MPIKKQDYQKAIKFRVWVAMNPGDYSNDPQDLSFFKTKSEAMRVMPKQIYREAVVTILPLK
jgi:hypothetical protein